MAEKRLGESWLVPLGMSVTRAFDRYILKERNRRERLSAELKWHEDRIEEYTKEEQQRFRAMRKILDEGDTSD
jgi:hypothetical protein